jgi:SAM-dependent methyltransferase
MKVFDAAMGMGLEAVFFAEHGCVVTGNEISQGFRELASSYAAGRNAKLNVTSADWRQLDSTFSDAEFDLILLLGNSFSLLRDPEERELVARNLRSVCRRGGRLVVDHRNFDYILENREEVLSGGYRYGAKVIFCGRSVIGWPVAVSASRVRFGYGVPKTHPVGYLDMYPFRMGELEALFKEAGFDEVQLYSDFLPGLRSDADFFTYVMR